MRYHWKKVICFAMVLMLILGAVPFSMAAATEEGEVIAMAEDTGNDDGQQQDSGEGDDGGRNEGEGNGGQNEDENSGGDEEGGQNSGSESTPSLPEKEESVANTVDSTESMAAEESTGVLPEATEEDETGTTVETETTAMTESAVETEVMTETETVTETETFTETETETITETATETLQGEWQVTPAGSLSYEKTAKNQYRVKVKSAAEMEFRGEDGNELTPSKEQEQEKVSGRMRFYLKINGKEKEGENFSLEGAADIENASVQPEIVTEGGQKYLSWEVEYGGSADFALRLSETEREEEYTIDMTLYAHRNSAVRLLRSARSVSQMQELDGISMLMEGTGQNGTTSKNTAEIEVAGEEKENIPVGKNQQILVKTTSTNSGENQMTRFWVDIDPFDKLVTDQFHNDQITLKNGGKEIVLYLDRQSSCIYYDLEAGDTASFNLEFRCENGISGEKAQVKVTVKEANHKKGEEPTKRNDPAKNDKGVPAEETLFWKGEFCWEPVRKTHNKPNLKLNTDGKLNEAIHYDISATSGNGDSTGEIWTEKLTFKDTLTLPKGVSLPERAKWVGNKIVTADGETVLFELVLPEGFTLTGDPISSQVISFTAAKAVDGTPQKEMENPQITAHLYAQNLVVAKDYEPAEEKGNNKITNQVGFQADAYNSEKNFNSSKKVETVIPKKAAELSVKKEIPGSNGNKEFEAGNTVPYKITLENKGQIAAEGVTVTDDLPLDLMLTEEQIKKLKEMYPADLTITEPSAGQTRYKLEWKNQTIKAGEKKEYIFEATIKSAYEVQEAHKEESYWNGWVNNVAYAGSKQGEAAFTYKKPQIGITKSNNATGSVQDKDKICYTVTVTNKENQAVENVVVTDVLPKGLKLLQDPEGGTGEPGQEVMEDGTYTIGGQEAKVTFLQSGETKIEWTIASLGVNAEVELDYWVQVDASKLPAADTSVTLRNSASLNYGGSIGSEVTVEKGGITHDKVIEGTDDPKKSVLTEGVKVTYLLTLENTSNEDIEVPWVTDTLPDSKNIFQWNEENVKVDTQGEYAGFVCNSNMLTWGDKGYSINKNWDGSATISWGNVTVNANTTLTQKVTLIFPSGEAWDSYKEAVGNGTVFNTFYEIKVSHTIEQEPEEPDPTAAKLYMQKGVCQLGDVGIKWPLDTYGSGDQGNSRYYYQKGNQTYVTYYFAVFNTGEEIATVPKAVDNLPEGVVYQNMISNANDPWSPSADNITTSDGGLYVGVISAENGNPYLYQNTVTAKVTATYEKEKCKITFTFQKNGKDLQLAPKQGIVFAYNCKVEPEASIYGSTNEIGLAVEAPEVNVADPGFSITHGNQTKPQSKNDGSCSVTDGFAYGDTKGEYSWLESSVTIIPTEITPGITKEAVRFIPGGSEDEQKIEADSNITESTTVIWEITVTNEQGAVPLHDYQIKDLIQYPYEIQKAEMTLYNGNGSKEVVSTEDGGFLLPEATKETAGQEKRAAVYDFDFSKNEFAINPGCKAVLTIYTKMKAGTTGADYMGSFLNRAQLWPKQDFKEADVIHGEFSQNGSDKWLEDSDTVSVMGGYATSSYKTIAEVGNGGNWGVSDGAPVGEGVDRYIIVSGRDKQVRYTLNVTNLTQTPLINFTLIDSLPAVGDRGTWDDANQRYSEFSVSLAEAPQFQVNILRNSGKTETLGSDKYEVSYSERRDFTADDWNGDGNWGIDNPEDAESFQISLGQSTVLQKGDRLEISFTADIGADADPGEIAWNSFGYRYYKAKEEENGSFSKTESYLTAAPPKVGVKIPEAPVIEKQVVDKEGNSLEADPSQIFIFDLYEGDVSGAETLPEKIGAIEVAQGGTTDLSQWLKKGHTYTLVEQKVPLYRNKSIVLDGEDPGKFSNGRFVFTFDGSKKLKIVAVNEMIGVVLPATGGIGTDGFTTGGIRVLTAGFLLMFLYEIMRRREEAAKKARQKAGRMKQMKDC